jgi:hypothetical protein
MTCQEFGVLVATEVRGRRRRDICWSACSSNDDFFGIAISWGRFWNCYTCKTRTECYFLLFIQRNAGYVGCQLHTVPVVSGLTLIFIFTTLKAQRIVTTCADYLSQWRL